MAYETGSAADFTELHDALEAFLQANGWTLTGGVLHKGDAYATLSVDIPNARLALTGGTGESGGSLTGAGPSPAYIASVTTAAPMAFPVTYHFHTHGDEAFAAVNWSTHFWTTFGFGASPMAGLPGTGGWYFGSYGGSKSARLYYDAVGNFYAGQMNSLSGFNATGPFWGPQTTQAAGHYVHHGLDGGGWSAITGGTPSVPGACASAHLVAGPLLTRSPSAWNGQAILVPAQLLVVRPSSKTSLVAEFAHMRYVSMANQAPGDIITLGTDQWQVVPFYRKGTAAAPASTGVDSGYLGVALRYDGP